MLRLIGAAQKVVGEVKRVGRYSTKWRMISGCVAGNWLLYNSLSGCANSSAEISWRMVEADGAKGIPVSVMNGTNLYNFPYQVASISGYSCTLPPSRLAR